MQARLAKEARDEAEVAVAKEPSHDLGHHLIGRHAPTPNSNPQMGPSPIQAHTPLLHMGRDGSSSATAVFHPIIDCCESPGLQRGLLTQVARGDGAAQ